MRKTLLLAAAMMLVLTACRAEANFIVDVAEDGSGDVTVELGLDEELLELLEGFGGTDQLFEALPEDQVIDTRVDGELTYYFSTQAFGDSQELLDTTGFIEGADASFADIELAVVDGSATLDASITAPSATEALEGLGGGGFIPFDLTEDILSSSLFVRLPGVLVETNADEILDDGTLRWDIPLDGGTVTVQALTAGGNKFTAEPISKAGLTAFPWTLVAGLAGIVVVLIALLWLLQRRRRASVAALEEVDEPSAPQPLIS